MKSVFITTIAGHDTLGIIKSLADTTREFGGEWITSKLMKLEGQFSALMKVSVDQDKEGALNNELAKRFPDLTFVHAPVVDKSDSSLKIVNLEIDCIDRPGLTRAINDLFMNMDLIVDKMECNRMHVSTIGEAVFNARLTLEVSESTDPQMLVEEIESLTDEMRVNLL